MTGVQTEALRLGWYVFLMLWCTQRICSYDGYLCTFFDVYLFLYFVLDFGDLDLHWCGCVTFKYVKAVVLYYKGARISIIIHTYMHTYIHARIHPSIHPSIHTYTYIYTYTPCCWIQVLLPSADPLPKALRHSLGMFQIFVSISGLAPGIWLRCGEVGIFPWRGDLPWNSDGRWHARHWGAAGRNDHPWYRGW